MESTSGGGQGEGRGDETGRCVRKGRFFLNPKDSSLSESKGVMLR